MRNDLDSIEQSIDGAYDLAHLSPSTVRDLIEEIRILRADADAPYQWGIEGVFEDGARYAMEVAESREAAEQSLERFTSKWGKKRDSDGVVYRMVYRRPPGIWRVQDEENAQVYASEADDGSPLDSQWFAFWEGVHAAVGHWANGHAVECPYKTPRGA